MGDVKRLPGRIDRGLYPIIEARKVFATLCVIDHLKERYRKHYHHRDSVVCMKLLPVANDIKKTDIDLDGIHEVSSAVEHAERNDLENCQGMESGWLLTSSHVHPLVCLR